MPETKKNSMYPIITHIGAARVLAPVPKALFSIFVNCLLMGLSATILKLILS